MVKPFENNNLKKSTIQIINTIIPLIALIVVGLLSYQLHWSLSILCGVLASGFIIRTFIIFHDCCHGSFLSQKKNNDLLGNITGLLTFFPYEKWRREHIIHHTSSGNLEKRGIGDIWVMTIEEYHEASKFTQFKYRMYRNPFVMFILGPIFLMFISNRMNAKDAKAKEKRNTWLHNIILLVLYVGIFFIVGAVPFVLVFLPMLFIAGMLGIWLFYIQHTFEDSYFEESSEWDYVKAAIEGSSYYKLPKVFQWMTGNIGYHHVHHLSPRIPNYQLEQAHEKTPPLHHATTITIKESLESLKYKLYDEKNKCFITFKEYTLRFKRTHA
ncbi:Delta(5) desaturase DesA [Mammaliicoccus sciuri]|uniref:fatty acid desaturase n=1 Tax=Mammaliicoccus sciuri TaxID=1296 RepID=UPI00374E062D